MLDVGGFVSETNATNIFMVKGGALLTPATGSCLPGITRYEASVLCICPPTRPLPLCVSLSLRLVLAPLYALPSVVAFATPR